MGSYYLTFEPVGKRVPCPEGAVIFEVAHEAGVYLHSLCGGKGTCGKCRIRILSGRVSPPTEKERKLLTAGELSRGYRLACMTRVWGNARLEIPPESLEIAQRLQLAGKERRVAVDPVVRAYQVSLTPPSVTDLRSDEIRLLDFFAQSFGLQNITVDLPIQRQLPAFLRSNDWKVKIGLRGQEIVWAGGTGDRLLGLAVDLGTTKIAAYLADLETGEVLAAEGTINSQIAYGEDVISRITYVMEKGGEPLRQAAVHDLNTLIEGLCARFSLTSSHIAEVVIVGNTAMHHLFLGLPVRQLALAPYVPAVSSPVDLKARDVGLATAPGAYVHFLPNIAGFVGADHVAMILSTGLYETGKTALGIDIGTNTEICLAVDGRLRSCSCASGPAFEGAHIRDGMRAAGGAIEKIKITNCTVDYQTIDDEPPLGLCGSGVLDAVAQLREAGVIDRIGRLQPHPRVRQGQEGPEFVLVPKEKSGSGKDIVLTQKDICEIQLAKAAISAGISILLNEAQIRPEDIEEVVVAGAFGSYIDVVSAIRIGMLPQLPVERFSQVGNAAGVGARLALISREQRELAREIAGRVEYVELTNHPNYPHIFTRAIRL